MKPFLIATCLLCTGLTTGARAQSPPSYAAALSGDAKAAYEDARRLFKAGDYAGSLGALTRLQKLAPDPHLFWNMAACEKKLGHHSKAIGDVEKYLASGGSALSTTERQEGERFVTAMRTLVAAVSIASANASTHEELTGVQLTVDDERVGTTPLAKPLLIDAGPHRVRASRPGYKDAARTETVSAGSNAVWTFEMEPIARTSPWLWVGASAVVVAGAIVGGYFLFRTNDPVPPSGTLGTFSFP